MVTADRQTEGFVPKLVEQATRTVIIIKKAK
jgi:hypothetical protein